MTADSSPVVVRVAVPIPLAQLFDYRVDNGIDGAAPTPGTRVLVPFGRREVVGVVVATATESDRALDELKPIVRVLDEAPLLGGELLATLQFAARYYQHPLGEVLDAALPATLREPRALPPAGIEALALTDVGRIASTEPRRRGTRIDALLTLLSDRARSRGELDTLVPAWSAAARTLRERGWIHDLRLPAVAMAASPIAGPPLHDEQRAAVDAIDAGHDAFGTFLLEGVTGSGKTEVYLALAAAALARGRQVLVLVPEIALTPQILGRFRERLGVEVAALHSGLADGERARAWIAAARGEASVILGTRSAVFVPLARPGLIVVDEEHDASYKQHEGFRYHARDLALVRAKALGVPVVLGSATPSLESLHNVESGRYRHLRLTHRAGGAQAPKLTVIDLRRQKLQHGLAAPTFAAIGATLARGEQVLVFKNRRGYAPVLTCHDCGWSARCDRCDRPLTLHRGEHRLRCHHCGAVRPIPRACPDCGGLAIAPQGQGTERLDEALRERFPNVPLLRIDRDTTRARGARTALLDALAMDGAGILVGTQMLAKGHDLPNLTLVVVVGVDEGLHSVDFRAAERLGQLVVQVAGRAGRAEKRGEVWLQTHHPDHPLLRALLQGGYRGLASALLVERRAAELPPFAYLALMRAEAPERERVDEFLSAAIALAPRDVGVSAQGPMPAPMPRRAGVERGQLLIESHDRSALHAFLADWLVRVRALPQARKVRWSIDVDPVDLY